MMNTAQTITVTVSADGEVSVGVTGCPGPGCQKLTAELERALGRVSVDQRTFEHNLQAPQQQQQAAGGGP